MTQPGAPFHILIVAPRPAQAREALSYATLEGLYEGIESQGADVSVEHLRPATAAALAARLGDASQPTVHLLALDGALAAPGGEPSLFLKGDAETLAIGALAGHLAGTEVPLTLLHLCPQEGRPEDAVSAARDLASRWGGPVLSLRPNLERTLACACMTELLAQLLAGEPLGVSVESAQQAASLVGLRNGDPLPIIQLHGPGQWRYAPSERQVSGISKVAPLPGRELGGALERLPAPGEPGALPEAPPCGLLGRQREMAELEALLTSDEQAPVWMYGYDGVGKTALAAQTARWLVRTGRFARVVYTSLGRSGMPSAALYALGRCLLGPEHRDGPEATEAIVAALAESPTLIIWDDLHAVLPGGDLAAAPTEVGEWYRLAGRLAAAGPSRLCLLSDGPSLPDSARRLPGARSLEIGLLPDAEASNLLVELCRWAGAPLPEPDALHSLVGALGGHPLTLRLMAVQFVGATPEAATTKLLTELPALAAGEARFRNQALEIAFDRLFQALPETMRQRLPRLGLFVGGFTQNLGLGVMEVAGADWEADARPLVQSGLLEQEPIADLTIPYVRIHPALKRLARQRLDQRTRQRMRPTFGSLYVGFASWLLQARESAPERIAALAYHDLGNLGMALTLILEEQDLVLAINYGRLYSHLLDTLGLGEEAKRAAERVQEATSKAIPREGPMGRPGVLLLWSQADRMVEAGQLGPASGLLRQLVDRMNAQGGLNYVGLEADLDRARTLRKLGHALRLGRRLDLALAPLRRTLEVLDKLDRGEAVRRERAEAHAELAEALIAAGQLDEAAQECQHGLQALKGLSEHAQEGGLYARLGGIAMRRGQTEQARAEYAQALERLHVGGDAAGMAAIEGQLAALALRPPADLDRAREHLSRALGHARESGNAVLEGQFIVQLAQAAAQAQDEDEAERLFRQAMALYRQRNILPGLIAAQANLAEFLLQQGRADDARSEAEGALGAAQSAGPDMAPWELSLLLQRIAQARNDAEEAARWRAATQEAFARSPQAGPVRMRWQPVIKAVAQGARGETMDAEAAQTIEEMENRAEWQALGHAIMRILSGERRDELWSDLGHLEATIVRAILEELEPRPETGESETPGA